MIIKEEEFSLEFFNECKEKFVEHLREVQVQTADPVVDHIRYIRASQRGELATFVARDKGKVVGYSLYWIMNDLNHETMIAQQAGLYMEEEYRRDFNAVKLIRFSEKRLKDKYKVDVIVHISTVKKDISSLFKYLGYKEAETAYIKEI